MKIIVEPAFDTPLLSFQFATRQGTAVDPIGSEGLVSHAAELSMRGAASLSREELDETIDALGASLGISLRRDSLALTATCLHRNRDALFSLAYQVLSAPHFSQSEHAQLKRETLFELEEMRDEDASLIARYFNRHFNPGHLYCRSSLGTSKSLASLQVQQARDLFPKLFQGEELVMGITGPIDEDEAQALAAPFRELYPDQSKLAAPDLTPPPAQKGRRLVVVDKPNRQQCQVAIGHPMPPFGSVDFDSLRIAEAAFGGMFSSRLMQEIRVQNGWSYGVQCSMYRARGSHALHISMAPAAEYCLQAISTALEMFSDIKQNGLHPEEFDFTRSYLEGSSAFQRATAPQRLSRKVQEEIYALPKGYGDGFASRIQSLSLATVNHAISAHFHPDDLVVVVVATADTVLAQLETLGFDSIEVVDYRSY